MKCFPIEFIQAVYELDHDRIRPDGYSGRGMYGKTCASVSFDYLDEAFRFFAQLGQYVGTAIAEGGDDGDMLDEVFHDLMSNACQDSDGRGLVVYFPGWEFV